MKISASLLVAAAVFGAGCSEDTVANQPDPIADAEVDTTTDAAEPIDSAGEETIADSTIADSSTADTATAIDSARVDTGLLDASGTFSCAGETCSTTLQYCRRATSPGICPAPDSGVCPAGCPGCPALPMNCAAMPTKCWAKPSCNCILVEACGSVANGTCTEKDGGFVAGCNGV